MHTKRSKSSPSWSAFSYLINYLKKQKGTKKKDEIEGTGRPLLVQSVFLVWVVSNVLFERVENPKAENSY